MKKTTITNTILMSIVFTLTACGGGGGSSSITSSIAKAFYLDSGVEGIEYQCDNNKTHGFTRKGGEFDIVPNKECKFYLNKILLRSVPSVTNNQKIIENNISTARLLQSLDMDANASNGITITEDIIKEIPDQLPQTDSEVSDLINNIKSKLPNFKGKVVTLQEAQEHLSNTISLYKPVANDINVSILTNHEANITLRGSDPQDANLTYTITQNPTNGHLSGNAPNITYTPNSGFVGNDNFKYKVNNGSLDSDEAVVNIEINSSSPIANDDIAQTNEDENTTIDVLANDTDAENDPLTISIVSAPTHGSASVQNGKILYTPNTNYNGNDSFTYLVNDSHSNSNTATVSISVLPVNDTPVANNDSIEINEDENATIDVLANDTDADNDPLTISIVSAPTHGNASVQNDKILYTPNADYNGSDTLSYQINDGHSNSNTATVSISVLPVNDAPMANNLNISVESGASINIELSATDIDGDGLTFSIEKAPDHGTATISGDTITYNSDSSFVGNDTIEYKVSDGNLTATATINITVTKAKIYIDSSDEYKVIDLGSGDINKTVNISSDDNRTLYILFTNANDGDASIKVSDNAQETDSEEFVKESSFLADKQNTNTFNNIPDDITEFNNKNIPPKTLFETKQISAPQEEETQESEGDQLLFHAYGSDVNATLKKIVSDINTTNGIKTLKIWVADNTFGDTCEKSKCLDQTMVDEMADAFLKDGLDNDIYDWVSNVFGEEWGPHDSSSLIPEDDEITILLLDINEDDSANGGTLGYFWSMENYTKDTYEDSNERIMFFIDSVMYANRGDDGTNDFWKIRLHSTLAHELQHMIHFYQRNVKRGLSSDVWFNEMLSVTIQDAVASKIGDTAVRGIDPSDGTAGEAGISGGRFPTFNSNNYQSLTNWEASYSYSLVGALGTYLTRNYGGVKILADMQHSNSSDVKEAIVNAVNENSSSSENKTFEDILKDWGVGVLLSNLDDLPSDMPRYNFGQFLYSDLNGTTYDLGSINFFNYNPLPKLFTDSGTVKEYANYYYLIGENIGEGDVDINISVPSDIKATLIVK